MLIKKLEHHNNDLTLNHIIRPKNQSIIIKSNNPLKFGNFDYYEGLPLKIEKTELEKEWYRIDSKLMEAHTEY